MAYGETTNRRWKLMRILLFSLVQSQQLDVCFQCDSKIETLEEFSIEHKEAWRNKPNAEELFFDLNNIAFSHLLCNRLDGGAKYWAGKTHCPSGHEYTPENTFYWPSQPNARRCRTCIPLKRQRVA